MFKPGERRDYVISLKPAILRSYTKKADKAVLEIKRFVLKHSRNPNILITNEVNQFLWQRGKFKIPKKIAVTLKEVDGSIKVYLKGSKTLIEEEKARAKKKKEKKEEGKEKKKEKKTEAELAAEEEKKRKLEEKREKEKAAQAVEFKRGQ